MRTSRVDPLSNYTKISSLFLTKMISLQLNKIKAATCSVQICSSTYFTLCVHEFREREGILFQELLLKQQV